MLCGYAFLVLMVTCRPAWVVCLKKLRIYCEEIVVLYALSVVLCVCVYLFFLTFCVGLINHILICFFITKFLA
jgi:hypothetical protein